MVYGNIHERIQLFTERSNGLRYTSRLHIGNKFMAYYISGAAVTRDTVILAGKGGTRNGFFWLGQCAGRVHAFYPSVSLFDIVIKIAEWRTPHAFFCVRIIPAILWRGREVGGHRIELSPGAAPAPKAEKT